MINPTANYPALFAANSTMLLAGVAVPKDAFLGGCVYTHGNHPFPWHLGAVKRVNTIHDIPQYVIDANKASGDARWDFAAYTTFLWDIVDSTGVVFATAVFYDDADEHSNIGHIIDADGFYAGCIKGSEQNNDTTTVYGIRTALIGIIDTTEVSPDAFVIDPCVCTVLPAAAGNTTASVSTMIKLSDNYIINRDKLGNCYITHTHAQGTDANTGGSYLKSLKIMGANNTNAVLGGEHVVITPSCVGIGSYVDGDVRVIVHENTLIIGNRGGLTTVL